MVSVVIVMPTWAPESWNERDRCPLATCSAGAAGLVRSWFSTWLRSSAVRENSAATKIAVPKVSAMTARTPRISSSNPVTGVHRRGPDSDGSRALPARYCRWARLRVTPVLIGMVTSVKAPSWPAAEQRHEPGPGRRVVGHRHRVGEHRGAGPQRHLRLGVVEQCRGQLVRDARVRAERRGEVPAVHGEVGRHLPAVLLGALLAVAQV